MFRVQVSEMEKKPLFKVEKKGLQTTFQDLGRHGYQQYGVVVSGAMDRYALQVANILAGNKRDEAAIEMTMMGPQLVALSSFTVAISGTDLQPKVNGNQAPMWKSFRLKEGDRLTFGKTKNGLRSYLAVAGGYDVPIVMGSKSTFAKADLGKTIEEGDTLSGYDVEGRAGLGLSAKEIPDYRKEVVLRVIKGPHDDAFTTEGLEAFFNEQHTVSPQSDRMGYRLKSPEITHQDGADIWTDAIPFGGIQIPASGQPIILMADRQTTGGYTRLATVISVDLPKVAQLAPGGAIRFTQIGIEEAQILYKQQERQLATFALRAGN